MCARCDLPELMQAQGLRPTPNRLAVYAALAEAREALSPPALLQRLRTGRAMDKVTLYRTLDSLLEKALVTRHQAGDGSVRYCAATPCHPEHHHFYCTRCQRLLCLDPQPMPLHPALPPGADLAHIHIRLDGTCPQCRS